MMTDRRSGIDGKSLALCAEIIPKGNI